MDQGPLFKCPNLIETRRLFWLFGLTFAAIMVIQFLKLPNGNVLSSMVSAGNFSFLGKWNSVAENDTDSGIPDTATNTYDVEGTVHEGLESRNNRTSFDNLLGKSNSSDSEDVKGSATRAEKARNLELNVSSRSLPEDSDTSVQNIQIKEFSSSNLSIGSSPPTVALTGAVSSPVIASPTNLELASPLVLANPDLSSVRGDEKNMEKTDDQQTSLQRNFSSPNYNSFQPDSSTLHNKSNVPTFPVTSISGMNELLLQSHSQPHSVPPKWNSTADQDLLNAKSIIQNAPIVENASGLHAPIYRNFSMFKRSYELMDRMLKVYIYKEGEKPIFHESILEGIYAAEGWFLNLLESNKQYITNDPRQAHLFFLPFSSRLLQKTLYIPHSHRRNNLIEYMKNYVGMLTQKYPFWNRTNGEDHFLAACHDWDDIWKTRFLMKLLLQAPAETRGPLLNCLRALCNADIKVGFEIGKDVSLPTTIVRSAQNTVKDIGGEPPSQRTILAFFAGFMHGNVRPILLDYWGKDPDMRIVDRLPHVKGDKNYIQHMKSSKYCICARGFAVNSPRVVESIFYECVPVIISDNYVPPFFEVLNWESFAVFILEKDIPNLKNILLSISMENYIEMQKGVKEVQRHFLWHANPVKYDLFHMTLHSIWYNRVFRIKSP